MLAAGNRSRVPAEGSKTIVSSMERQMMTGWWLSYFSDKYNMKVNRDDHFKYMGKIKLLPNHQPDDEASGWLLMLQVNSIRTIPDFSLKSHPIYPISLDLQWHDAIIIHNICGCLFLIESEQVYHTTSCGKPKNHSSTFWLYSSFWPIFCMILRAQNWIQTPKRFQVARRWRSPKRRNAA